MVHSRLLQGEDLVVKASPDPLESCPWEIRFTRGDKALIAKVETQPGAELIKAAFECMRQVLGANAPELVQQDINNKLSAKVK